MPFPPTPRMATFLADILSAAGLDGFWRLPALEDFTDFRLWEDL